MVKTGPYATSGGGKSTLEQKWNRVFGSWVTGSAMLTGSGRVTGQCVRPSVWPGFEF